MRYLLDTHVVLWVLQGAPISGIAKNIMDDVTSEVYVSIASAWEVAIKVGAGKLKYAGGVRAFLDDIALNEFNLLGIQEPHVEMVEKLTNHHRDPFDRLLIATAMTEGMTILTADENIQQYNVLWAW